jgi:hypothetical protein
MSSTTLVCSSLFEHLHSLGLVAGVATHRSQRIGRQCHVACGGETARHVLDVGVEAAVLMDHDDAGRLAGPRRGRQVPAHLPGALGRLVVEALRLDARILRLHLLGEGEIRREHLQEAQRRDPADGIDRRAVEELAARDAPMDVAVEELHHFRGEVCRRLPIHVIFPFLGGLY